MIEFKSWPKTPRLFRGMTITEKIDGTNAAIHIRPATDDSVPAHMYVDFDGNLWEVVAQSRKRLLVDGDNFGFANWVRTNAFELINVLGEGTHYGEWWGAGIQRTYGLTNGDRRFSLFDVHRYADIEDTSGGLVRTVPRIVTHSVFDTQYVKCALDVLREHGSLAVPGYNNPEGVIVWHDAGQHCYKVTYDDNAKGQ